MRKNAYKTQVCVEPIEVCVEPIEVCVEPVEVCVDLLRCVELLRISASAYCFNFIVYGYPNFCRSSSIWFKQTSIASMPWPHAFTLWFHCYLVSSCHLVLSCLILSYLILSCSYLILSYLILSYLILSYLILSYLILSYILSCLISYLVLYLILSYILSYLVLYLILSYLIFNSPSYIINLWLLVYVNKLIPFDLSEIRVINTR
jgi:hypothetical protein